MLVAQNSLGPVCPVPLTVRGTRIRLPTRIKLYYCGTYGTAGGGLLRYQYGAIAVQNTRLTNASRSCILLSSIPPPCDGEARLRKLICVSRGSGALARLRHGQFPRLWSWRLRQPRRRGERLLEAGRIQPGTGSSVQRQGNFFSPSGVAFVTGTRNAS